MSTTTTVATEPRHAAVRGGVPLNLKVTQGRVIKSEWLKFRSLRSTYYSLGAALIGMIGFGALFAAVIASQWDRISATRDAATIDPVVVGLRGYFLVQLIVGVLGVLIVTGEYSTGMIRSSFAAAPHRLPVVWAKALVFAAITFVITAVGAFLGFFLSQAILNPHLQTTLSAPDVLRSIFGAALYVTGVGLLGAGFGWIIRNTAGAIATLFGILLILPVLVEVLPTDWQQNISPYLPSTAGTQLIGTHQDPGMLAPWTGFALFVGYLVVVFAVGAVLLRRRDA